LRRATEYISCTLIVFLCSLGPLAAQLSPGDLSNSHAQLEGMSNCTQCHVIGNKVSVDKCLACHTEIRDRIAAQKGYHSSAEVKRNLCFACHSEHNGKNFKLIRLDITKFDHNLTGYQLSTPHAKKECKDCHTAKNITDQKLKAKKSTYLGVNTECLTCHTDYHQQTLSATCLNCHTPEAFKPASKFSHTSAKFQLTGKHKSVDCIKCHKVETVNGKKFQEFKGLQFSNCTSCHNDPHKNQFGQNCRQCHNEESFHAVKGGVKFDHSKTNFKLEEKHLTVACNACHKGKLTDPLKYSKCTDCHADYHNGQFGKNGVTPDCSQCHSVKGFNLFTYTIDQHNSGPFPLQKSHGAVPCTECHKKQEKWSFRQIGMSCKDCHKDIHQKIIEPKYYPDANCKVCHNEGKWSDVTFNHSATGFNLDGAHNRQTCRVCHFKTDSRGIVQQKFYELTSACSSCHADNHFSQFAKGGVTTCTDCHGTENWKASKFDHNNTLFKLDGKHINVACAKCHKPTQEGSVIYVKYKLKDYKCESCH
jgi:nitrate/TMAO reductase-like tetraheme cytochrome c subunit